MSYEITFGGRFQAGLNITTGKVVVKAGSLYLPATTANVALYPIAGLVVRYQQVPSANYDVGDIAHAGVWPSSLTGLTAATAGVATYARVTSTGSLESTTAPADGDQLMGRINSDGDLILAHEVYSVIPANTVQTIVNIMDYGAVCDGVTDDSDAWDAVMADVPVLGIDVIEVPKTAGGCAISRPIRMCSTDPNYLMNGVTIRGQLATPAVAPALTYLVWLTAKRTGATASLVSTANDIEPGADYLGFTWTHFLLSGCTGANFTPGDVGTTGIRIEGAANTLLNAQMRITKYVSSTSVYVGIQNLGAFSDANNGAITWTVLDSMIYMQGRALSVQNISPLIPTGKYVYNYLSYTHPTGESNQLSVTACSASGIRTYVQGSGVVENLLEMVQWIVPTTTQVGWLWTFQTAVNGQYRPWSPYQGDFFTLTDAVCEGGGTTYTGACIRSANVSGQSRGNVGTDIGALNKEYVVLERSDFPNANGSASSTWILHRPVGGAISEAMFVRTSGQAQMVIHDVHWEVGAVLLKTYGQAGQSNTSTMFIGGYVYVSGTPPYEVDPVGLFQISDACTLTVVGMPIELVLVDNNGGYLLDANNSGRATVSFIGCTLPDHLKSFGKATVREMFNLRGQYCEVNIIGCNSFKYGVGNVGLGDIKFVGGVYAAGAGLHAEDRFGASHLMRGTSNSLFTAMNYFGVVTISGTETRKTWVFVDPEIDEDYSDHYYEVLPTLLSTSGAVAATCIPKLVETSRRSCTLEMAVAPGVGTSVTYGLRLIRHNQAPTTAFHPQDIPNLYFYFDAEYDVGYNVAISPELQDNSTGRLYWRNQASRRALAYTNVSAFDPYARTSAGADDPTRLPSTTTDAAFNNKTVATFTSGKTMGATVTGSEAAASPWTLFVVGQAGTGTGDKTAFRIYANPAGTLAEIMNDGTNTYIMTAGGNVSTAHTWANPEVMCFELSATTSIFISAITATIVGGALSVTTDVDDSFIIGNNHSYTRPWSGGGAAASGKIAALLLYKGALSVADRTSVTNWLGTRYGITIAP